LVYTYQLFLPAGIYQVRVAVHDEKSGRTGSAHAWIEIPDLSSHHLALSSVLIGERPQTTLASVSTNVQPLSEQVTLSIDRYFRRNSYLRFLVYVYNAARAPADSKPDIALQTQILRDDQPVLTTALRKVNTEAVEDLDRLPYAAEILLTELPVGRYLLKVTVIDRATKTSASQYIRFEIH
jgi:hypothetical protein